MNYNPAAHTRPDKRIRKWSSGVEECSCGWVGLNFDLHIIAMQVSHEVFTEQPHMIEEEP